MNVTKKWITDKDGNLIAPNTLITSVVNSDGSRVSIPIVSERFDGSSNNAMSGLAVMEAVEENITTEDITAAIQADKI